MAEGYYFEFDLKKDALLQRERGVGFEQIVTLIEAGRIVDVRTHHNPKKYPHQHIIEVDSGAYIYLVPCVITGSKIFLKTIYPSRKAQKAQKKGKKND